MEFALFSYLINHKVCGKKVTEWRMCVQFLSTAFDWTVFLSDKCLVKFKIHAESHIESKGNIVPVLK
jgi:hypothetical protein